MSDVKTSMPFSASWAQLLTSLVVGGGVLATFRAMNVGLPAAFYTEAAQSVLTVCSIIGASIGQLIGIMFALSDRPLMVSLRKTGHVRVFTRHLIFTCGLLGLTVACALVGVLFPDVASEAVSASALLGGMSFVHILVVIRRALTIASFL
jgi:hypothetical protein